MNLMFFYKLAKKSPKFSPGDGHPDVQKAKIQAANAKHSEIINKSISPHMEIDPLADSTGAAVKESQDNVDTQPTAGYSGSVYGATDVINKDRKAQYLSKLFKDLEEGNFKTLGDEPLLDYNKSI